MAELGAEARTVSAIIAASEESGRLWRQQCKSFSVDLEPALQTPAFLTAFLERVKRDEVAVSRERLQCARCNFCVHSLVEFGGFCCHRCSQRTSSNRKKHGSRCEKRWADDGAKRSLPFPPYETQASAPGVAPVVAPADAPAVATEATPPLVEATPPLVEALGAAAAGGAPTPAQPLVDAAAAGKLDGRGRRTPPWRQPSAAPAIEEHDAAWEQGTEHHSEALEPGSWSPEHAERARAQERHELKIALTARKDAGDSLRLANSPIRYDIFRIRALHKQHLLDDSTINEVLSYGPVDASDTFVLILRYRNRAAAVQASTKLNGAPVEAYDDRGRERALVLDAQLLRPLQEKRARPKATKPAEEVLGEAGRKCHRTWSPARQETPDDALERMLEEMNQAQAAPEATDDMCSGHAMDTSRAREDVLCGVCHKVALQGTRVHGCHSCGWYMCGQCHVEVEARTLMNEEDDREEVEEEVAVEKDEDRQPEDVRHEMRITKLKPTSKRAARPKGGGGVEGLSAQSRACIERLENDLAARMDAAIQAVNAQEVAQALARAQLFALPLPIIVYHPMHFTGHGHPPPPPPPAPVKLEPKQPSGPPPARLLSHRTGDDDLIDVGEEVDSNALLAFGNYLVPHGEQTSREDIREVYVDDVRYTQDTIKNGFSDGRTLRSTINELLRGDIDPLKSSFLILDVCEVSGILQSLFNRRLFCLKTVQKRKADKLRMKVRVVLIASGWESVERARRHNYTLDDGETIRVRGCASGAYDR